MLFCMVLAIVHVFHGYRDKAQYEKYSNNGNATPIKLIEMKHISIKICIVKSI